MTERLVNFSEFQITESNFPTLSKNDAKAVIDEILSAVPREQRVIALDRVLANIDTSQIRPRNVSDVRADPTRIFFSEGPAVLLSFDGNPIWSPIAGSELQFAVNTNWDLFRHPSPEALYLRVDNSWLKASSIDGRWSPAGLLPDSFARLPNDDNWKDVKAADGAPKYVPVTGTGLFWVSKSESDVFRMGANGTVYFLTSGRWFSAPAFSGPWTFATPGLPDDFKKIPLDHLRSRVLASVPGTPQALEAVLLADHKPRR